MSSYLIVPHSEVEALEVKMGTFTVTAALLIYTVYVGSCEEGARLLMRHGLKTVIVNV